MTKRFVAVLICPAATLTFQTALELSQKLEVQPAVLRNWRLVS